MSWFKKLFQGSSEGAAVSDQPGTPEDTICFYQQLGFFSGREAAEIVQRFSEDHGHPPDPGNPWDDVFLLAYAEGETWASDPEADVCAENEVYLEVLPAWARISQGAFTPMGFTEHWESESGPITLSFQLDGQSRSISPSYQDDWLDLEILLKMNALIVPSGRQFECAVDGNFALVMCLTPEQKATLRQQRRFPFAW